MRERTRETTSSILFIASPLSLFLCIDTRATNLFAFFIPSCKLQIDKIEIFSEEPEGGSNFFFRISILQLQTCKG